MTALKDRHCKSCEGGTEVLSGERAQRMLAQVDGWRISDDGLSIRRRYEFKSFYKTMAFINAMAWVANQEGHHPDFCAGYSYCDVTFTTHAVGGLSENDFICAARLNAFMDE